MLRDARVVAQEIMAKFGRVAEVLLNEMKLAREGKAAFTLVIEDPLGNSAIVDECVCVESLTPEEAADLQTGAFVITK